MPTPLDLHQRYLDYQQALLKPELLPGCLADGFIAHDLPPGMSLLDFRQSVMRATPDQRAEVLHLSIDGDRVWGHLRVSDTHSGPFRDVPPTGKRITFEAFDVVRFDQAGKVAERWALVDWLSIFRQLGVTQLPTTDEAPGGYRGR
jgi:predicted ester cyclase